MPDLRQFILFPTVYCLLRVDFCCLWIREDGRAVFWVLVLLLYACIWKEATLQY